jgi:hypothetical protein
MESLSTPDLDEELDDTGYMTEVDKRIEVTNYYRELLRSPLFGVSTEAARIVERKVRLFVKEQLEILLGMRRPDEPAVKVPPPPPLPFSELQVTALQVWANKLLSKPEVAPAAPPPKPEPQVRTVAPPAQKPVAPVVNRPAPAAPSATAKKPPTKSPVKPAAKAPSTKAEPKQETKKKQPQKTKEPDPAIDTEGLPPGMKWIEDPDTGERRAISIKQGQVKPKHMRTALTPAELAAATAQQAHQALAAASTQDPLIANITATLTAEALRGG